jgi:hypothetical protein
MQFVLAVTLSHRTLPFPNIRFTFDDLELASSLADPQVLATIHHGPCGTVKYGSLIPLVEERLSAFSVGATPSLTTEDARSILCGEAADRAKHGRKVLAHGDPIHLRSLLSLMRIEPSQINPEIELHQSYSALAEAAKRHGDCLVFGLRPSIALPCGLTPVAVNGVSIWEYEKRMRVPGQLISMVWPSGFEWNSAKRAAVLSYLKCTLERAEADLVAVTAYKHGVRRYRNQTMPAELLIQEPTLRPRIRHSGR